RIATSGRTGPGGLRLLLAGPHDAAGGVLEDDALREELLADTVRLGPVLRLARGFALGDPLLDLRVERLLSGADHAEDAVRLLEELHPLRRGRGPQASLQRVRAQLVQRADRAGHVQVVVHRGLELRLRVGELLESVVGARRRALAAGRAT